MEDVDQLLGRQRRELGGLEDYCVAARQGRPDFVTNRVQGGVERSDSKHDADRYSDRECDPVLESLAGSKRYNLPAQASRLLRAELKSDEGAIELVANVGGGEARLAAHQA